MEETESVRPMGFLSSQNRVHFRYGSDYSSYFDGRQPGTVEITPRHQRSIRALELRAKGWKEAKPVGQAGFYPVEDAWNHYWPVGLLGEIGSNGSLRAMNQSRILYTKYRQPDKAKLESNQMPAENCHYLPAPLDRVLARQYSYLARDAQAGSTRASSAET